MNSKLIKQQIAGILNVDVEDVEIVEDPEPDQLGFVVVNNVEYVFDCYRISENREGGLREGSLKTW